MSSIRRARSGAVETVTIDRPERRNALDVAAMRELRTVLESIATDASVRAVLLTGAGAAFCAGGDVAVMDEYLARGELAALFHALTGEMEGAIRELVGMPKPVLAALPGVAAGGGLSLALACDWRIAAESATLVPAFPALGAVPDGGLTYFLPHFLGVGLAQELLFTHARLTSARARDLGLVHEVVADAELPARAEARVRELAEGPTGAYGATKRLIVASFGGSLESQMMLERRAAVHAAAGPELPEGIRAFTEKRPPRFPPP
ncbi:MAG TPA: enoyl-CoA hydratase-related protein [Thermoplasmata archaeon]|nr:enoyl-CoA hydratase-related protein [Thermoplasmata archaeon]